MPHVPAMATALRGLHVPLACLARALPPSLRHARAQAEARAEIRRATADPAFAARAQDLALLGLIARARAGSPAYRQRLDAALGSDALDAPTLRALWHRIPILTRADVAREGQRLCTVDPRTLDACRLGESGGRSVMIHRDPAGDAVTRVFQHEAWVRAGFAPRDLRSVFRGFTHGAEDAVQELTHRGEAPVLHPSDAMMADELRAIRRRGAALLEGVPSALAAFAAYLLRHEEPLDQVRGVLPTSEPLSPTIRALLERAFPRARLIPVYGLRERIAFAAEHPDEPDTFVFDPLYGFTELVGPDGAPVIRPGARGRLIATGLRFPGMPLIRYDTGDEAELVAAAVPANGRRLIVRRIRPRCNPQTLVGRSGAALSLAALIGLDPALLQMTAFQFEQEAPGRAVLRVVPGSSPLPDLPGFLLRVARRTAGELDLSLEIVERIPATRAGTRPMVVPGCAAGENLADRRAGARAST
ncbi:CoF synthetase [Methylobacterium sp. JK268]